MGKEYIECLSKSELIENIYGGDFNPKIPLWKNTNGNKVFSGFYYFSPNSIKRTPEANFIIARKSSDPKDIVGIVKLGAYNYYDRLPDYWLSCYSDVRKDRWKQGVITRIYKSLNNILTPEDFLVGTRLSEMGEKASLHILRKRLVHICPVFDSQGEFLKYCEKNGLLESQKIKRNLKE